MSPVATGWDSPYQGLSYFGEEDSERFFGRDRELQLVKTSVAARPLTLLYGASGTGKSSLLRGGVARRLREEAMAEFADQQAADLVPVTFSSWYREPVAELVTAVENAVEEITRNPTDHWPEDPLDVLRVAAEYTGGDLVLILDQFEEFFRYGADEGFADLLVRIPRARDVHVSILLSMREDELATLDRLGDRIPGLFDHRVRLEHLGREQAQRAIVGPLEAFNATHPDQDPVMIEPELVDAIIMRLRTPNGRVEAPLLQLICSRLWEEEHELRSSTMRLSTLEAIGGPREVMARLIDASIQPLSADQRRLAEDIFQFLVTPSGVRIALSVADLAAYADASEADTSSLLKTLSSSESRLIRPVAPRTGEAPYYEIYHDLVGAALLDWRRRAVEARLEREKREAAEHAHLERSRARRFRAMVLISALLNVVLLVLVLARS